MDTAAHDQLQRSRGYRWVEQKRLGREAAMQFVGFDSDKISLSGTIYPQFRGGMSQIEKMHDAAKDGEPLSLIDGNGTNLGKFCVTKLTDTRQNFIGEGLPRKIQFQMELQSYGENAGVISGGGEGGSWLSGFFNQLVRRA